jgi:hypothetical protein
LGAHVGILQLENVAYSNLPEIFVNGISHNRTSSLCILLKEKALTVGGSLEKGFWQGFAAQPVCGKAEDGRG